MADSGETGGTEKEDASDEDDDNWSDIENVGSDEEGDSDGDGEDYDDEWSDDDDDVPPDFNEGQDEPLPGLERRKTTGKVNGAITKSDDRVLFPVFPDGTPRERW